MHRKILQNLVSLGAVQALTLALPLVSLPYLANVLGAAAMGRLAFALAAAQIVVVVSDYGFELAASKAVSIHRDDPVEVTRIWCTVSVLRALLVVAALAILALAALASQALRSEMGLIACACAMVAGGWLYPHWLFQGLERLALVSGLQALARILCFAALFILVRSEADVAWATFLQSAGLLLTGLLTLPLTLRQLRREGMAWPSLAQVREQLNQGRHIFWSSLAVNIYTSSNAFFLGLVASASAVGQFHVAEKVIRAAQSIYGVISHAVYPHVVRLAMRDEQDVMRFNRILLLVLPLGGALLGIGVYVMAEPVVLWLLGDDYADCATLLKVLACLPFIVALSNVFGVQTMLPLGMDRQFKNILIASAALDLVLFFPMVQAYGALGAAWVNVAVEMFVTGCMAVTLQAMGRNPLTYRAAVGAGGGA